MAIRVAHRHTIGALVLLSLILIFLNLTGVLHLRSSRIPLPSGAAPSQDGSAAEADWPSAEDKVIVIASLRNQSTEWVLEELPEWQSAIYVVNDPDATLKPPKNKGREAMVYLTYVIDNYDKLPSTVAFLHFHRWGWPTGWHTDAPNYDNVISMRTLKTDFIQKNGYANLRCLFDPGCPAEIQPFRDPPIEDKPHEIAFAKAWKELLGSTSVPDTIATPCCSQFAVSKGQILKRPKAEYVHYRKWLLDTPLDDFTSGRIFEYLWHVIFGQDPVYCPEYGKCYCDVYGRC